MKEGYPVPCHMACGGSRVVFCAGSWGEEWVKQLVPGCLGLTEEQGEEGWESGSWLGESVCPGTLCAGYIVRPGASSLSRPQLPHLSKWRYELGQYMVRLKEEREGGLPP